jgi:EAL domain-containing protein (putative c-di-GMP-specific phosphodiesterase class I)
MDDSDGAKIFVKTIIDMAKNLRLDVTAEGIETADHAAALCAMGCDVGQGYFFGRPGAAAADGGPTVAEPTSASQDSTSHHISPSAPEPKRHLA